MAASAGEWVPVICVYGPHREAPESKPRKGLHSNRQALNPAQHTAHHPFHFHPLGLSWLCCPEQILRQGFKYKWLSRKPSRNYWKEGE